MRLFFSDLKRLTFNPRTYLAIAGLVVVLFISLQETRTLGNGQMQIYNAYESYAFAMLGNGHVVTVVCCALPFATVFCEDIEHHYIRQFIIRKSIYDYVFSKWVTVYFSSVLTMMAGVALFIAAHTMWADYPLYGLEDLLEGGTYGYLFKDGHRFLYIMIDAFYRGMLAGTLSVVAALLSLYIHNKASVLATPVLLYQTAMNFSGYHIGTHLFGVYTDLPILLHLLLVTGLSFAVLILCFAIAVKRIKKLL